MNVTSTKYGQKDDVVISVKSKSFSKDKGQNYAPSKPNVKRAPNIT